MSDTYSISVDSLPYVRREEVKTVLPKQWRHWCKLARLRPMGSSRKRRHGHWHDFYLIGRGRVWRINCYGEFECGDTYAEFDRWALCDIRRTNVIPKTEAEFLATVKDLLKQHNGPSSLD